MSLTNFGCSESSRFDDRLNLGLKFETHVEATFKNFGLLIFRSGLGSLPVQAKETLVRLNDPVSQMLRFGSDFFCVVPERFSFFVEAKTSKTHSVNYSYNLACFQAAQRLAMIKIQVLAVFGKEPYQDVCCEWAHRLKPVRTYNGSHNGSGKPFILVEPSSLTPLREFLETEGILTKKAIHISEFRGKKIEHQA